MLFSTKMPPSLLTLLLVLAPSLLCVGAALTPGCVATLRGNMVYFENCHLNVDGSGFKMFYNSSYRSTIPDGSDKPEPGNETDEREVDTPDEEEGEMKYGLFQALICKELEEQEHGWIGFGVTPHAGRMLGGVAVVGFLSSKGEPIIKDYHLVKKDAEALEETVGPEYQKIDRKASTFVYEDGVNCLYVERPLEGNPEFEFVLPIDPKDQTNVILAAGSMEDTETEEGDEEGPVRDHSRTTLVGYSHGTDRHAVQAYLEEGYVKHETDLQDCGGLMFIGVTISATTAVVMMLLFYVAYRFFGPRAVKRRREKRIISSAIDARPALESPAARRSPTSVLAAESPSSSSTSALHRHFRPDHILCDEDDEEDDAGGGDAHGSSRLIELEELSVSSEEHERGRPRY